MSLSTGDLATLSLLDPDQGVCPKGHACRLDGHVGDRCCMTCDYRGLGLICWDATADAIDRAEELGARPRIIIWAKQFVMDRSNPSSA